MVFPCKRRVQKTNLAGVPLGHRISPLAIHLQSFPFDIRVCDTAPIGEQNALLWVACFDETIWMLCACAR